MAKKPAPAAADDKAKSTAPKARPIIIAAPKFEQAAIPIVGTAPLVIHNFSAKSQNTMVEAQEAGSQGNKGRKREPKDFQEVYDGARHIAAARFGGWDGFAASGIRNAMISACRVVGFKMTLAKLSLFVIADGYEENGTPLVRITKGEPSLFLAPARNANGGTDIRARPKWEPGWEAEVTIKWDGDQFSATDVVNLLSRVGQQVGIGEGRADSRMSAGCGWGSFEVRV